MLTTPRRFGNICLRADHVHLHLKRPSAWKLCRSHSHPEQQLLRAGKLRPLPHIPARHLTGTHSAAAAGTCLCLCSFLPDALLLSSPAPENMAAPRTTGFKTPSPSENLVMDTLNETFGCLRQPPGALQCMGSKCKVSGSRATRKLEKGYESFKGTCPARQRHVLTLNERTLPGKIMASAPTCTPSHSSECEICAWSPTRTLSSRWQPVMWAPRPMWQLRPITEASTCEPEVLPYLSSVA